MRVYVTGLIDEFLQGRPHPLPCPKFLVSRILTCDLFAVANVLVWDVSRFDFYIFNRNVFQHLRLTFVEYEVFTTRESERERERALIIFVLFIRIYQWNSFLRITPETSCSYVRYVSNNNYNADNVAYVQTPAESCRVVPTYTIYDRADKWPLQGRYKWRMCRPRSRVHVHGELQEACRGGGVHRTSYGR